MNADEIKKTIDELQKTQSQIRTWRVTTILVIIAVMLAGIAVLYNAINGLVEEGPGQTEFVSEFTSGFKKNVLPVVGRIVGQTFSQIKPAVEAELAKLDRRSPELLGAFERELLVLSTNMPARGEKVLQVTFGNMLKKREPKIRELYPEATEQNVSELVVNLTAQADAQIEHISDSLFAPHLDALNGIMENLDTIQKVEAPNLKEEVPTWEMAVLLYDVFKDDFKDLQLAESTEGK
jgi:hypothetical protein